MKLSKKSIKTLKRMSQGHGRYAVIITLPDNSGSYQLLMKFNCGKPTILKIYKDGNSLANKKALSLSKKINLSSF